MTRSIQPGQTTDPKAEYDPKLPLPYPYHIDDEGNVQRQDFWKGSPARLLGFQHGGVQRISLTFRDWMAGDADAAIGLCPVFIDEPTQLDKAALAKDRNPEANPAIWADSRPVTSVAVS